MYTFAASPCTMGQFVNATGGCSPCPVGTYMDLGYHTQMQCMDCPGKIHDSGDPQAEAATAVMVPDLSYWDIISNSNYTTEI